MRNLAETRRTGRSRDAGVTLLELMVVLGVLTALSVMAVPSPV